MFSLESLVTSPELYNEAKAFWQNINAGEIKADHSKSGSDTAGNAAPTDTAPKEAESF